MNNQIVEKPWGYEYLAYQNDDVALWVLHIRKGQSTSMHCHPRKTTGLIVLSGKVKVSFLADERYLTGIDKVMIRRGLFHSTIALTDDVVLLELETPPDKEDLVRLSDLYGRAGKAYETDRTDMFDLNSYLQINDDVDKEYIYSHCNIKLECINSTQEIINKYDDDLLVFLRGGLIRKIGEEEKNVTIPGDVGFANIVKQVAKQLDGVRKDTIILTINK
jgi:mannose-6-phosphate isomerase-like protein (cupin superfamily)